MWEDLYVATRDKDDKDLGLEASKINFDFFMIYPQECPKNQTLIFTQTLSKSSLRRQNFRIIFDILLHQIISLLTQTIYYYRTGNTEFYTFAIITYMNNPYNQPYNNAGYGPQAPYYAATYYNDPYKQNCNQPYGPGYNTYGQRGYGYNNNDSLAQDCCAGLGALCCACCLLDCCLH